MKNIVVCSSAAFYEHVNEIANALGKLGYKATVPATAKKMKSKGNYKVSDYKTWYKDKSDFDKKAQLMRGHFDEIAKADAILVVNDTKDGQAAYIGPNALMEMGLAFYLEKPVYVLNDIDKSSPIYEEVLGMKSSILNGDLSKISF